MRILFKIQASVIMSSQIVGFNTMAERFYTENRTDLNQTPGPGRPRRAGGKLSSITLADESEEIRYQM